MPEILGNMLIITLLTITAALAARSVWKTHKSGGHCNGDCGNYGNCRH